MYRLLPFIAAVDSALPINIPIEIWSLILRNLDPVSLLSAIRSESHLKDIAKGDPVLRERVKKQLDAEKVRRQEEILNPGLLISVERNGPTSSFFGRNQAKRIRVTPPTPVEPLPDFFKEPYQQRKSGKTVNKRNKKTRSPVPAFKSMRC